MRKSLRTSWIVSGASALLLTAALALPSAVDARPPARAVEPEAAHASHDRIAAVRVEGNARVDEEAIRIHIQTRPGQAVNRNTIDSDVHVIGISSQAAGHKTLVPELGLELKKQGADDILIVVGGVIPAQDYDMLKKAGAAAIFGPGTNSRPRRSV